MPSGIPYIIGNDAAERFSFYGMKAILVVFMTQYLFTLDGTPDFMSEAEASKYIHFFNAGVYFFPFFGALLADLFWGKYNTIFWLSLLYCLGHLVLAVPGEWFGLSMRTLLFTGLFLIGLGAGGIKSCVSAHVGDQFGSHNEHLLERAYGWFYLAINLGAFFSMLITPWLLKHYGHQAAFALPGILMGFATFFFWLGRHKFVHIPPNTSKFLREVSDRKGLWTICKVTGVFLFLIIFWAIYDQNGSRWVTQSIKMDPHIFGECFFLPASWRSYVILPSQMQAVNPLFILIFIPLLTYVVYPLVGRVVPLTPVRKMAAGLFLIILTAWFPVWFESRLEAGETVNMGWQILAYMVMTLAEVMVSVTSLEFAYTQAPRSMKSFIMGIYFMSLTCGNLLAAEINHWCDLDPNFLPGVQYYRFFLYAAFINAILFLSVVIFYKEKTILQEEDVHSLEIPECN